MQNDATDSTWEEIVLKSNMLVATLFYSPTCPHCRVLKPVFEELSTKYVDRIKFVLLNSDAYPMVAQGYGVMGVPTIKFFCGGRPISDILGNLPKEELENLFNRMISSHKNCLARSTPIYYT